MVLWTQLDRAAVKEALVFDLSVNTLATYVLRFLPIFLFLSPPLTFLSLPAACAQIYKVETRERTGKGKTNIYCICLLNSTPEQYSYSWEHRKRKKKKKLKLIYSFDILCVGFFVLEVGTILIHVYNKIYIFCRWTGHCACQH